MLSMRWGGIYWRVLFSIDSLLERSVWTSESRQASGEYNLESTVLCIWKNCKEDVECTDNCQNYDDMYDRYTAAAATAIG